MRKRRGQVKTPFPIKAFCESAGTTVYKAAQKSGISYTQLVSYQCGRRLPGWLVILHLRNSIQGNFAALDEILAKQPLPPLRRRRKRGAKKSDGGEPPQHS